MENGDGEYDKVKTTPSYMRSKQTKGTHLKSDDKDLATHRPEQGVPKSGEGFIDFIGQVGQTPKGNLFLLIQFLCHGYSYDCYGFKQK